MIRAAKRAAGRGRARTEAGRARAAETAGAVEPFRDAALYDWEYRRRRDDVAFYRMLAAERGGPVLDLGCGTGRLAASLIADGIDVVGVDLSRAMLLRARQRCARALSARGGAVVGKATARGTALLLRGDLRALPVRGTFPLVVMAFHTIQHLIDDDDLLNVARAVRERLGRDGWFAFDVFAPSAAWLARPAGRRFDATIFRHPTTKRRIEYSLSHQVDAARRALHMRFHYRPLSETGTPAGRGRVVRLCHRLLAPADVKTLLDRAGLKLIGDWGGFHDEPLGDGTASEQHVYLARPAR